MRPKPLIATFMDIFLPPLSGDLGIVVLEKIFSLRMNFPYSKLQGITSARVTRR
jgi:hypothetical protein